MKQQKPLTNEEISSFCSQCAMLISAGFTPADCINVLLYDTTSNNGRELLEVIHKTCIKGVPLHQGLTESKVFPHYVIRMVAIGEESGNLDVILYSLADYYERENSILKGIRDAVTYPMIMLTMMAMIIFLLISKVLPIFEQVFAQLGSQAQGVGGALMSLGTVLNQYSLLLVAILLIFTLTYFFFTKMPTGKKLFHQLLPKLPFTKTFTERIAAGRFANGMALTLGSGMDTITSLNMVKTMVDNRVMEDKIEHCIHSLNGGANLTDALVSSTIFSNFFARMISVGFRTGTIDIVMNKIATSYEKETTRKINNLISIVEPTLVIILSIIVGLILLSVILPLMSIMSSMG